MELSPSPPNLSKDSWKLLPLLILMKFGDLMSGGSCANTYYDVTDFVNHEMAKNTKTWIS